MDTVLPRNFAISFLAALIFRDAHVRTCESAVLLNRVCYDRGT